MTALVTNQPKTASSVRRLAQQLAELRRLMPSKQKRLSAEQRRQIAHDLHDRWELLKALSQLTMKRLAAKYGVHNQTIWRLDEQLHGCHIADPSQRHVKPNASEPVSAE